MSAMPQRDMPTDALTLRSEWLLEHLSGEKRDEFLAEIREASQRLYEEAENPARVHELAVLFFNWWVSTIVSEEWEQEGGPPPLDEVTKRLLDEPAWTEEDHRKALNL